MRQDNRSFLCMDTVILAAPLLAGTIIYGSILVAEIGIKSVRTLIWGKR